MIELSDVKLAFAEWLFLKDHEVIDVLLGAVVANLFDGPDALNLHIVGPPSSSKTELLRSLSDYPAIYTLSTLTPQTLISGIKGGGGSLLLNLKKEGRRLLIIKDLTTILEMRSEARQEVFGQLREVADGYLSKSFGTGKTIQWSGKLGILAGVTPVIDEHHAHNQILGERFLYCRVSNEDPRAMATRARKMAGREITMRGELREVVKEFLLQFQDPKIQEIHISDDIEQKLINLACFIAEARTGVSRDRWHRTVEAMPEAEGPARLVKQLWVLGAGVTTIQGKTHLDAGVYSVLKRIAVNSLPRHRNIILKNLWEGAIISDQWEATKAIGKLIGAPTETTKRYLEDLWMLGLLNRRIEGEDSEDDESWKIKKAPYSWQLSRKTIELIEMSEIYFSNGHDFGIDDTDLDASLSPQYLIKGEKERKYKELEDRKNA